MRQTISNICCSKRIVPVAYHVLCGALWHTNTKQDKVYPAGQRIENRRRPAPPPPPPVVGFTPKSQNSSLVQPTTLKNNWSCKKINSKPKAIHK